MSKVTVSVLVLTLMLSVTCAQKFHPEMTKLTPEQFQKLLYAPVATKKASKPTEQKLEVLVSPSFVMWGQKVTLTCVVPQSYQNKGYQIRFGIEGIAESRSTVQRIENSMVVANLECGTWKAICEVADDFRVETVTVVGACGGR